jgi:hypothetical protein
MLKSFKRIVLPLLAATAMASSMHAAALNAAYWGEGSTTAGTYNTEVPASASQNGSSIVGVIPTNGSDVVNYFRTYSDLAGGAYDGTLLGNLTSYTELTATFSLNDDAMTSGDQFSATDLVGESNAGLRLMFMGHYLSDNTTPNEWWSNPLVARVTSMGNGQDLTLTVAFDPSQWSNYNGHVGTESADTAAQFADALSDVTRLGISFGSGSFFSNGFSFNSGDSAYLQLDSMEALVAPEPATFGLLAGALGVLAAIGSRRRSKGVRAART